MAIPSDPHSKSLEEEEEENLHVVVVVVVSGEPLRKLLRIQISRNGN